MDPRAVVLFNHFAELIVPFAYFAPAPVCAAAGLITIVYQGSIWPRKSIVANFLTIILAIPVKR